jgi:hypothetical protein
VQSKDCQQSLADRAMEEAKAAEDEIKTGHWRGPLHGIPVGIKDMFDTAGVRTTAAFEHFKERVPAIDAVAVRKLKEAGAVIVGKMNMHKLAMGTTSADSCFGAVDNVDERPASASAARSSAIIRFILRPAQQPRPAPSSPRLGGFRRRGISRQRRTRAHCARSAARSP